jgi:hypothetical protein
VNGHDFETLGDISAVKIAPDRTIDPVLLFQRSFMVLRSGDLSVKEVLSYELSPFPPALFETRNILQKADKPQIAQAIQDLVTNLSSEAVISSTLKTGNYVLDGGSLLHRLPWNNVETCGTIASSYADFTVRHYRLATMVFNGYGEGPSEMGEKHSPS